MEPKISLICFGAVTAQKDKVIHLMRIEDRVSSVDLHLSSTVGLRVPCGT